MSEKKMRIADYYRGWIADNICKYCCAPNIDECYGCNISELIESDEVEKENI